MSRIPTLMKLVALTSALGCFTFSALAEPHGIHAPPIALVAQDPIETEIQTLPAHSLVYAAYVIRDLAPDAVSATHIVEIAVARDANSALAEPHGFHAPPIALAARDTIETEIQTLPAHSLVYAAYVIRDLTPDTAVARDALTTYGMKETRRALRGTT